MFSWLELRIRQSIQKSRIPVGLVLGRLWAARARDTRHKWKETAIRLLLLIASQCQDGTSSILTFVSFTLIELLKKNQLPFVL